MPTNRRTFLATSLSGGAGLALSGCATRMAPHSRVIGANDDVRIAIVGLYNKGAQHVKNFDALSGVRIVALCDVDRALLDREAKRFLDRGDPIDLHVDYRAVLDDPNIDAVVLVTPDHWHALQAIWACQAGKHVYLEKPVTHCISEGEPVIRAARKYGRIVQAGTQRRSDPGLAEAIEYLRAGNLGKIKLARAVCYGWRESLGRVIGPQPIPKTVDYNLWVGPAPMEPLGRAQLHYDWRFFWDIGCGDQPNQGVHIVDLCRWLLGVENLEAPAISIGGRYVVGDDGQTPNTQIVYWDTKPAPMLIELRNLPRKTGDSVMDHYRGVRMGMVVDCEGGYVADGSAYDNDGTRIRQFPVDKGAGHAANFIAAVRSGNRADLNADILEGYRSTALCLLGNISHRAGVPASGAEIHAAIGEHPVAVEAFLRCQQHLAANGVDLSQSGAVLGPWLRYDEKNARFQLDDPTANLVANRLLVDAYRKPFEMPARI